jgi:hypothetical protein
MEKRVCLSQVYTHSLELSNSPTLLLTLRCGTLALVHFVLAHLVIKLISSTLFSSHSHSHSHFVPEVHALWYRVDGQSDRQTLSVPPKHTHVLSRSLTLLSVLSGILTAFLTRSLTSSHAHSLTRTHTHYPLFTHAHSHREGTERRG